MANPSPARSGALIIDPRPNMATLVADMLRALGYRDIREANDAHRAQLDLRQHQFSLIIIDDAITGPDAVDLIRRLRADTAAPNRLTPVIMMAAAPDASRIAAARDAGVTEFVRKPFAARDLKARLDGMAANPRAFVEAEQFSGPDRRRKVQNTGTAERRSQ
jgi:two-component system chemotaxis response regulator CheY